MGVSSYDKSAPHRRLEGVMNFSSARQCGRGGVVVTPDTREIKRGGYDMNDDNSLGWDGLGRADMDRETRDVDDEYNGRLVERTCNYCDRSLLSHEKRYSSRTYGKVCQDCRDDLRGEDD
jgi:hypothetical protein